MLNAALQADRTALETFEVDNADLKDLEKRLTRFNIFEATGLVRQELRHSDFLAFLLDPRESHGLGDVFLRRFLQRSGQPAGSPSGTVSPIDLDQWSLSEATVLRE